MTMDEAEEFIASIPWRHVKMVPVGEGLTEEKAIERWGEHRHVVPDPHEYTIRDWREVDTDAFDAFVRLIQADGYRARYRAPYRPDYVMTNHYLEINGWCYWFIHPNMLNRERAEHRSTSQSTTRQDAGPLSLGAISERLSRCLPDARSGRGDGAP